MLPRLGRPSNMGRGPGVQNSTERKSRGFLSKTKGRSSRVVGVTVGCLDDDSDDESSSDASETLEHSLSTSKPYQEAPTPDSGTMNPTPMITTDVVNMSQGVESRNTFIGNSFPPAETPRSPGGTLEMTCDAEVFDNDQDEIEINVPTLSDVGAQKVEQNLTACLTGGPVADGQAVVTNNVVPVSDSSKGPAPDGDAGGKLARIEQSQCGFESKREMCDSPNKTSLDDEMSSFSTTFENQNSKDFDDDFEDFDSSILPKTHNIDLSGNTQPAPAVSLVSPSNENRETVHRHELRLRPSKKHKRLSRKMSLRKQQEILTELKQAQEELEKEQSLSPPVSPPLRAPELQTSLQVGVLPSKITEQSEEDEVEISADNSQSALENDAMGTGDEEHMGWGEGDEKSKAVNSNSPPRDPSSHEKGEEVELSLGLSKPSDSSKLSKPSVQAIRQARRGNDGERNSFEGEDSAVDDEFGHFTTINFASGDANMTANPEVMGDDKKGSASVSSTDEKSMMVNSAMLTDSATRRTRYLQPIPQRQEDKAREEVHRGLEEVHRCLEQLHRGLEQLHNKRQEDEPQKEAEDLHRGQQDEPRKEVDKRQEDEPQKEVDKRQEDEPRKEVDKGQEEEARKTSSQRPPEQGSEKAAEEKQQGVVRKQGGPEQGTMSREGIEDEQDMDQDGDRYPDNDSEESMEAAEREWDMINEIRQKEIEEHEGRVACGSSSIGGAGAIKARSDASRLVSVREAIEELRLLDLSDLKNEIKVKDYGTSGGLRKVSMMLFGRPKLRVPELRKDRELVFLLAKASLDRKHPPQMQILQTLYKRVMVDSRSCPSFGSHWMSLGFQGNDPGTDLRGAGLFGLLQLLALIEYEEPLTRRLIKISHDKHQNFPFAVVSLNWSGTVMQVLREGKIYREINRSNDLFRTCNELHASIYYAFLLKWKNEKLSILHFGDVRRDLSTKVLANPMSFIKRFRVSKQSPSNSSMTTSNMDFKVASGS